MNGCADLTRAACLAQAHFSREFRRAFGNSPHTYLLTQRVERAAALLRGTDTAVADILPVVRTRDLIGQLRVAVPKISYQPLGTPQ